MGPVLSHSSQSILIPFFLASFLSHSFSLHPILSYFILIPFFHTPNLHPECTPRRVLSGTDESGIFAMQTDLFQKAKKAKKANAEHSKSKKSKKIKRGTFKKQ